MPSKEKLDRLNRQFNAAVQNQLALIKKDPSVRNIRRLVLLFWYMMQRTSMQQADDFKEFVMRIIDVCTKK